MPRPLGDRTRWTFGFYPNHGKGRIQLQVTSRLFSGRFAAEEASERLAAETGCEVTPPLRVRVEIPKGVRR